MESSERQLNPCSNLDKHNVANAIVVATAVSPVDKPTWKAMIVTAAIISPSNPTWDTNFLFNRDSFIFRGFSFISFLLCGSKPIAIAGRLSVNKLINNRCIGRNGAGNAKSVAYKTTYIAPAFPDNRNLIAFLILA